MSLNPSQVQAVIHKDGPCMVLAGPGSGKTLTITKRIEYLIGKHHVSPEEILVITFTKAASIEMKERFVRLCGQKAGPVTFGTFHGIYYGILKWAYRMNASNILSPLLKMYLLKLPHTPQARIVMLQLKAITYGILAARSLYLLKTLSDLTQALQIL